MADDKAEIAATLDELDRRQECSVCDGYGFKENGITPSRKCGGCDGKGKTFVYSTRIRGLRAHIEALTARALRAEDEAKTHEQYIALHKEHVGNLAKALTDMQREADRMRGALEDLVLAHRGASHALDGPVWKALERANAALSHQADDAGVVTGSEEPGQSVIAALNSHDMWINPDDFDRAADEITCGALDHGCEHARTGGGCYAEARNKYCPWIVAETLRAVGAVARKAALSPVQQGGK